jgi:HSP20 family protein
VLTISANVSEQEEITGKFTRREFRSVSFKRSFTLPETVNEEGIRAAYEAGILNIALPKKEEQQKEKRLIEIA